MSPRGQGSAAPVEDPRIGRTRQAVREATLQVLATEGYAGFTLEKVAASARVARSTLYRHWPSRIELVADAVAGLNRQPDATPEVGTARQRAHVLVEHLIEAFASSKVADAMPALVEAGAHSPEVATFLHEFAASRRRALTDAIAEGVQTGELDPRLDPEMAARALAGAVMYSRFMTPEALAPEQAEELVTTVLGPAE